MLADLFKLQVKAEKYSARTGMIMWHGTCPRTPSYDHEEPANSLVLF